MEEKKLSKKEIEKKLAEYKKIGWTKDVDLFDNFISLINVDNLSEYAQLFFYNLSELGKKFFIERTEEYFYIPYNSAPSKKLFLEFFIKENIMSNDYLLNEKEDESCINVRLKTGYYCALTGTDFNLYELITERADVSNEYLALELKEDYKNVSSFPITIENLERFLEGFQKYFDAFKEVGAGYFCFLIGIKAQQMLEKLSNYNSYHNLEMDNSKPIPKKLKWIGTPAQFGFIINELIGKGYIEKPTSSYNKDAEFYLSIIDIETTKGNLSNEVNLNKNSFSASNAGKFTIPFKDKLS